MATYYHGNTELQNGGDGLQTLILMNPSYLGFSDNAQQTSHYQRQQSPNTNNVGNNLVYLPHAPPQHYMGIPLSTTSTSQDQAADVGFVPKRIHYNLYNLPMDTGPTRDQLNPRPPQGLSLSLSSHQQAGFSLPGRVVTGPSPPHTEDVRGGGSSSISPSSGSGVSNNNGGVVHNQVLLGSKYLKAAQELLDEVVNVGKGHVEGLDSSNNKGKSRETSSLAAPAQVSGGGDVDGGGKRPAAELSTAERQEIQMKKAKLVNMLDEVEQRYRQYHHQMHIVISWFEQAAGLGSAKTYTALALQTISKQFRCLKDAILNQIKAASKSLGEEDGNDGKIEGSRLKYVDNQIRQQRALQQLGMIQHNAWRPQRGLPERAVSVLRAWLFEHFLHPYPKDSDKITLAKQTGLTRSQVSNWFINARVRLWKPMVEEMYMEEMKENEKNLSSEDRKTSSKSELHNEDSTSKSTAHPITKSPIAESQNNITFIPSQENPINQQNPSMNPSFNLIVSSEMDSIAQSGANGSSPKKLRISHTNHQLLHSSPNPLITSMNIDSKPIERDTFTLMGAPTNFIGGFGSYPMAELGRFGAETAFQTPNYNSGNSVSLTLGLPHCDNNHLSITAGHHHSFMPGNQGVELGESNDHYSGMSGASNNAHNPSNVYESINIQDRKRFVAQLLPDFVA